MTFSYPKNNTISKPIVYITSQFAPTNDSELFVFVKLAFVALLFGTALVDGSSPSFLEQ